MAERLPFADFLDLLRADGIQVGLGTYLTVGKLLAHLETSEPTRLGSAIAAVIARSAADAERIKELFYAYCSTGAQLLPAEEPPPPALSPSRTTLKLGTNQRPSRLWALLALLSLPIVVVVILARDPPTDISHRPNLYVATKIDDDPSANMDDEPFAVKGSGASEDGFIEAVPTQPIQPDLAVGNSGGADHGDPIRPTETKLRRAPIPVLPVQGGQVEAVETADSESVQLCQSPSTVVLSQPQIPAAVPRLKPARLAGVIATAMMFLIFFLHARRIASRSQRARRVFSQLAGPALYTLTLRDLAPPLTREELDNLATLFDRLRIEIGRSRIIDLKRSLLRRLRAEVPPLVFSRSRRRLTLVILRELSPELCLAARLSHAFSVGMKARGSSVLCYYFRGSAEWVSETPDGPPIPIEELLPLSSECVLFVVGSSLSVLEPNGPPVPTWLMTIAQFQRRIWLMPDGPQGPLESRLRKLAIPYFPQSYAGLRRAARLLLQGEDKLPSVGWAQLGRKISEHALQELQRLIQLAPHATPELAELLRQRYAPQIPEHALTELIVRNEDRSGETLTFAQTEAPTEAARHVTDPMREALVRSYLLQVLLDSRPSEKNSLADLRWRLDRAVLTLQIPDPRQATHPQARIELLALLNSPLADEVTATTAQRIGEQQLLASRIPRAVRYKIVAARPGWMRFAVMAMLFVIGPILLTAATLSWVVRTGWLYRTPSIEPNALGMTFETDSAIEADSSLAVPTANFSPDGRTILTLSATQSLETWDVATELAPSLPTNEKSDRRAFYLRKGQPRPNKAVPWLEVTVFDGHERGVWSADFRFDGLRVVTASDDEVAKVWDVKTGVALLQLKGHRGGVNSAAYSSDGRRIVTASDDRTAIVWDADSGKPLTTLIGHSASINDANYSPDGHRILTASNDGTGRVWNAQTGQLLLTCGHSGLVASAAYSPDGRRIVTASQDGTAQVWNSETGERLQELTSNPGGFHSASYAPDGKRIVTVSSNNMVLVWDAETGRIHSKLKGQLATVSSARYSPNGRQIVTASLDNIARVWDAENGNLVAFLSGHNDSVKSAKYSADGRWIVTASSDRTARLWRAQESTSSPLSIRSDAIAASAIYSPDGSRLVVTDGHNTASVQLSSTRSLVAELKGHQGRIMSASFSPNGNQVITASLDGTARIWEADLGIAVSQLNGHIGGLTSAVFSPDGRQILTGSLDGTAAIWDALTGRLRQRLYGNLDAVVLIGFVPNGRKVITVAKHSPKAQIFDSDSGQRLFYLSGHNGAIRNIAFSPDGRQILTASNDTTARLWDAANGNLLDTLAVPCGIVHHAVFSPDGKSLATGTSSGAVQIWSIDGKLMDSRLDAHEGAITSLAFSPDGKYLLSAGTDHIPKLYDIGMGRGLGWVQSERRFASFTQRRNGEQVAIDLTIDLPGSPAIGRVSLDQLGQGFRLPLPTPNQPHNFRAESINGQDDLFLSPPLLLPGSANLCQGGDCVSSTKIGQRTKITGNRLNAIIHFDNSTDKIQSTDVQVLDELVRLLSWRKDIQQIRVEGHSDNSGNDTNNLRLSERYARAVSYYLGTHGLSTGRLVNFASGSHCPLAGSDTPEHRAQNRRVEFWIISQDGVSLEPPACSASTPVAGTDFPLRLTPGGVLDSGLTPEVVPAVSPAENGLLLLTLEAIGVASSQVRINGEPWGGGPVVLSPGNAEISISNPFYRPDVTTVLIEKNKSTSFTLQAEPTFGILTLDLRPPTALLKFDGGRLLQTKRSPLVAGARRYTLQREPGRLVISASQQNYQPQTMELSLSAGAELRRAIKLAPTSQLPRATEPRTVQ